MMMFGQVCSVNMLLPFVHSLSLLLLLSVVHVVLLRESVVQKMRGGWMEVRTAPDTDAGQVMLHVGACMSLAEDHTKSLESTGMYILLSMDQYDGGKR